VCEGLDDCFEVTLKNTTTHHTEDHNSPIDETQDDSGCPKYLEVVIAVELENLILIDPLYLTTLETNWLVLP